MALTNGPLFSLDASGQVGKALVYSKWKGRPYVRKYVIPTNPNSMAQRSVRMLMTFLTQQWGSLSDNDKNSWAALAAQSNYAPFNAYTSGNISQFNGNIILSKVAGFPGGTAPGALTNPAATGGVGSASFVVDYAASADNWAVMLFASQTTGFTPGIDNMVGIVQVGTGADQAIFDVPSLEAGTWYFVAAITSIKGEPQGWTTEDSAVVT